MEPRVGSQASSLVVASDSVMPAQYERVVFARMESPLGVKNGLVERSLETHPPGRHYVARTLARDHPEVHVRALKITRLHQKLTKGSPLANCKPHWWTRPILKNYRSSTMPRSIRT
jgi:hypothetical protein